MVDHGSNIAMATAWQWANAARAQMRRVYAANGGPHQVTDSHMLLVAVRNVRRAASMAVEQLATVAAQEQLRAALDDFDAAVPGSGDARNVLEHFDEYSLGIGQLQQPGVKKQMRVPNEQLAQQYRVSFEYIDNDVERLCLHVGPVAIDINKAAHAASRLVYEIWAAVKTDEGDRVTRQAVDNLLQE
jgi:hypothetical protein